jgi:hypothetical protein
LKTNNININVLLIIKDTIAKISFINNFTPTGLAQLALMSRDWHA